MLDKVYLVDITKINRIYSEISKTQKEIQDFGHNVGNMVWYQSVKRRLKYDKEIGVLSEFDEPGIYVFPMANQISADSWQLEMISKKWCKAGNRVVLLGLGAKIGRGKINTPKKLVDNLPISTVDALKKIMKYGSIMVRGKKTEECLKYINPQYVCSVLGCPSFYYSPTNMEKIYEPVNIQNGARIAMSFDDYDLENTSKLLDFFYSSGFWDNAGWIMQTMWDMPLTITEGRILEKWRIEERFSKTLVPFEIIQDKIQNAGKIFFNFDEWGITYKSNYDMIMGMKFHGTMMGAINGIPSIWITHDDRTEELCEVISLPHIRLDEIIKKDGIKDAVKEAYEEVNIRKYIECFEKYKEFLRDNGLSYHWD